MSLIQIPIDDALIGRDPNNRNDWALSDIFLPDDISFFTGLVFKGDYVLSDYGTGAIMAVPSGDERDLAFAHHHQLEVIEVIDQSADAKTLDHRRDALDQRHDPGHRHRPGADVAHVPGPEETGRHLRDGHRRLRVERFHPPRAPPGDKRNDDQ